MPFIKLTISRKFLGQYVLVISPSDYFTYFRFDGVDITLQLNDQVIYAKTKMLKQSSHPRFQIVNRSVSNWIVENVSSVRPSKSPIELLFCLAYGEYGIELLYQNVVDNHT